MGAPQNALSSQTSLSIPHQRPKLLSFPFPPHLPQDPLVTCLWDTPSHLLSTLINGSCVLSGTRSTHPSSRDHMGRSRQSPSGRGEVLPPRLCQYLKFLRSCVLSSQPLDPAPPFESPLLGKKDLNTSEKFLKTLHGLTSVVL